MERGREKVKEKISAIFSVCVGRRKIEEHSCIFMRAFSVSSVGVCVCASAGGNS